MLSYYDLFGLKPDAGPKAIARAYRAFMKKNHPDQGGDPEVIKTAMKAYETLSDPHKKAVYDEFLRGTDKPKAKPRPQPKPKPEPPSQPKAEKDFLKRANQIWRAAKSSEQKGRKAGDEIRENFPASYDKFDIFTLTRKSKIKLDAIRAALQTGRQKAKKGDWYEAQKDWEIAKDLALEISKITAEIEQDAADLKESNTITPKPRETSLNLSSAELEKVKAEVDVMHQQNLMFQLAVRLDRIRREAEKRETEAILSMSEKELTELVQKWGRESPKNERATKFETAIEKWTSKKAIRASLIYEKESLERFMDSLPLDLFSDPMGLGVAIQSWCLENKLFHIDILCQHYSAADQAKWRRKIDNRTMSLRQWINKNYPRNKKPEQAPKTGQQGETKPRLQPKPKSELYAPDERQEPFAGTPPASPEPEQAPKAAQQNETKPRPQPKPKSEQYARTRTGFTREAKPKSKDPWWEEHRKPFWIWLAVFETGYIAFVEPIDIFTMIIALPALALMNAGSLFLVGFTAFIGVFIGVFGVPKAEALTIGIPSAAWLIWKAWIRELHL